MQLFSEDYLMHYGVKGMKWKKRKKDKTMPSNDLYDAIMDVAGEPHGGEKFTEQDARDVRQQWTNFRRYGTDADTNFGNKEWYTNQVYNQIKKRRNNRLSSERKDAYEANSERVAKRQKNKTDRRNAYNKNAERVALQQKIKTVRRAVQKLKDKNKRRSRPTTNIGNSRRQTS